MDDGNLPPTRDGRLTQPIRGNGEQVPVGRNEFNRLELAVENLAAKMQGLAMAERELRPVLARLEVAEQQMTILLAAQTTLAQTVDGMKDGLAEIRPLGEGVAELTAYLKREEAGKKARLHDADQVARQVEEQRKIDAALAKREAEEQAKDDAEHAAVEEKALAARQAKAVRNKRVAVAMLTVVVPVALGFLQAAFNEAAARQLSVTLLEQSGVLAVLGCCIFLCVVGFGANVA